MISLGNSGMSALLKFFCLVSYEFFVIIFLKNRSDYVCPANHFLGHFFNENHQISEEVKRKVNDIKQQYFNGHVETFDDESFEGLSNAFTDSGFHYGTDQMARYVSMYVLWGVFIKYC